MKKITFVLCTLSLCTLFYGCTEKLNAPELPEVESDALPEAVTIDDETASGIWKFQDEESNYIMELTEPAEGIAIISHTFINATSQMRDSVMNMEYRYTLENGVFTIEPTLASKRLGASSMKAVYIGEKKMELFVVRNEAYYRICTLTRKSGVIPFIASVNKTMPQVGETVIVNGRNLGNVSKVYLPVADGWKEITSPVITGTSITFTLPAGDYVQGSVRCVSDDAHVSVYSPAYMFAKAGVMMHSFNEYGTTKADHYAGTEFEYSISDMGQLRDNVRYFASANLPAGHSLAGSSVLSPDSMLSFFGETPIAWPAATNADDVNRKGYLRFSIGDRLQTVLARYESMGNTTVKKTMLCSDLALQMDLYVMADGEPEWNTGYISIRLDKGDNGKTSKNSYVGNVAGWEQNEPMRFDNGWQTYTIPLSSFPVTNALTIEQLVSKLLRENKQTLFTVMNDPFDSAHPVHDVSSFQLSIANLRLVPINTPANTEE